MTFWDFASSVISANRDVLLVLAGAVIGVFGSLFIWQRQVSRDRRVKKRSDIVHASQLALKGMSHTRSLMYAKLGGLGAVAALPDNPIDELMAVTHINIEEIFPLVQEIHLKQQEMHAKPMDHQDTQEVLFRLKDEIEALANKVVNALGKLSEKYKA